MLTGRTLALAFVVAAAVSTAGGDFARAECALPHQLTNEQLADARQVMGNFTALQDCLSGAGSGGPTNGLQYNAGAGLFGGVAPLTDGQLLIGATGGIAQGQTLAGGNGILIANAAGSVTISHSAAGGLYGQVMSATPTSTGTGLTNWLNQGSAVVSDSAVGVCINAPSSGSSDAIVGRYMTSPTPPYKITALIAATRTSSEFNAAGLGWYDGSSKLHLLSYTINASGTQVPYFVVSKWTNTSTSAGADYSSPVNDFAQPIWMQIADNGTNVSFAFSQDGANFLQLFSVAKSSGYLGSSGYGNVIFYVNPKGSRTLGTVMSWAQE